MKPTYRRIMTGVGCGIVAALLVSYLLPARARFPDVALRNQCQVKLQQIGTALLTFSNVWQRHLPTDTNDSNGKPAHSWRTWLRQYLDEGFNQSWLQLHIDEPWDSPNNKRFTQIDAGNYRCPSDSQADPLDTSYVAIIGPGTAWQRGLSVRTDEITDNPHDTILLVEMKDSGIKWAEPRDLDLDNLPHGITKENLLKNLSNHPGGFNALFADGHVEFIPETIPWSQFEAMLTIAGGEKIDREKW